MLSDDYVCDPTPNGLSDNCIGCICEASTKCNQTTQCVGGVSKKYNNQERVRVGVGARLERKERLERRVAPGDC
jgi:hypothetical protein